MTPVGAWANTIPEGIRDAIGRRVNRMSETCNDVLRSAALIGREFQFRLLRDLNKDLNEDRLLKAPEEALTAGVSQESSGPGEGYQFSRALVQQTLSEELSIRRRVWIHARIGETLEDSYGAQVENHAAALVPHFAASETVTGTEKLVHYSFIVGERALTAYSHEQALFYFQRALATKGIALEGTEPAGDPETGALLFGMGRARAAAVQRQHVLGAVENLSRAFVYYASVGDTELAVTVAEYPISHGVIGLALGELIGRALQLAPHGSRQSGRLLSRNVYVLGHQVVDDDGPQKATKRSR